MDVERIQKINDLALDLMKQGLATSRDEAVAQAQQVYERKGEDTETYRQIREHHMLGSEPKREEAGLHQDKIKEILQQNTTFLVQKIKEFQSKVESVEKELSQLRQQIRFSAAAPPPAAPKESSSEPKKTESHPRSGNYTDQDVSIEKYFYMGHK